MDPLSQKILIMSKKSGYLILVVYDPTTDSVIGSAVTVTTISSIGSLVYAPDTDSFWYIGAAPGETYQIVLPAGRTSSTSLFPNGSWATNVGVSGTSPPSNVGSGQYGFAYDTVNKIVGGFVSNGTFYAFNPATKVWKAVAMQVEAGSVGVPDQSYFCIDFDQSSGCFILLSGYATHTTWAYRYSGSGGTPQAPTMQGLWWNAPGGSESGWGINLAHQGNTIFLTWFTYDLTGKAWWLSMTANKTADNSYTGTITKPGDRRSMPPPSSRRSLPPTRWDRGN